MTKFFIYARKSTDEEQRTRPDPFIVGAWLDKLIFICKILSN